MANKQSPFQEARSSMNLNDLGTDYTSRGIDSTISLETVIVDAYLACEERGIDLTQLMLLQSKNKSARAMKSLVDQEKSRMYAEVAAGLSLTDLIRLKSKK